MTTSHVASSYFSFFTYFTILWSVNATADLLLVPVYYVLCNAFVHSECLQMDCSAVLTQIYNSLKVRN